MSDENDSDDSETIRTIGKRWTLLDRLAAGPTSKRDLRDDLKVSRSTVYKAVRELESAGLVEETDAGPRLTLVGRLLTERYRSFVELVDDVRRYEPLLSVLPPNAPVTTDALQGADLVLTERHAPNLPVSRIEELVRGVDRAWALAPVALPRYVDLFYEEILSGMTAEVVLERPVVEYLQTDFSDQFSEAAATGRFSVRGTDETLPFGLILIDRDGEADGVGGADAVGLIVYSQGGELRGVAVNDTPTALEWGRDTYERYAATAERIELE